MIGAFFSLSLKMKVVIGEGLFDPHITIRSRKKIPTLIAKKNARG
jgi:hypothetical protein